MRTDDFDELKPQDTNETRPDIVDIDGDDGFNEFDQPAQQGGKSLGDLWRTNPIIKLAVVGVGVVAVLAALVMFGGDKDRGPESSVGAALQEREAPGGQTSESYREAINEVNQQRLDQAMREGTSAMPIPVGGPDTPAVLPEVEEPPVTIEDPLENWRASNQAIGPQQPLEPSAPVIGSPQQLQQQQAMQQQALGPDPAAVNALAQAMSQQMQSILDRHAIRSPQVMAVTAADYFTAQQEAEAAALAGAELEEPIEIQEIIIPAGTIVYAQTLTEANTDAPGPVLARLSSGPLTGARVLGSFDEQDEYLTLNFNTIVVGGISQSVNAVALDPKTTLPAVVTDVDHRYWKRVILPTAARFIEGMGEAIAQREQTVTVNNGTTVSSQPDLRPREELAAGFAEGTQELGDELDRMANQTRVMVKVRAGTPIGILFLDPVVKQN